MAASRGCQVLCEKESAVRDELQYGKPAHTGARKYSTPCGIPEEDSNLRCGNRIRNNWVVEEMDASSSCSPKSRRQQTSVIQRSIIGQ